MAERCAIAGYGGESPPPGPFRDAAVDLCRHGLAVIPVGGDDGKVPAVTWGKWRRPPGRQFVDTLVQKFPAHNIGAICHLSGVTVVDIDNAELVDLMAGRCGDTPLMTRTPSGGIHLWYRHDGEQSANLRAAEGLAVDVKGVGGFVVVPPSIRPSGKHAGKTYQFLAGSWADLGRLQRAKPGSLPKVDAAAPHALRAVRAGTRNNTLFKLLLRQVRHCDDLDCLLDVAGTINSDFVPPLPDAEVTKTAASVWKTETEGRNWAGRKEAMVMTTATELQILKQNPDAYLLRSILQCSHGASDLPFAVSPKAMADADLIPGWGRKRYETARDWLVANGFLVVVHTGGHHRGDISRFQLGSSPEGAICSPHNKGSQSRPNITKHPSPSMKGAA